MNAVWKFSWRVSTRKVQNSLLSNRCQCHQQHLFSVGNRYCFLNACDYSDASALRGGGRFHCCNFKTFEFTTATICNYAQQKKKGQTSHEYTFHVLLSPSEHDNYPNTAILANFSLLYINVKLCMYDHLCNIFWNIKIKSDRRVIVCLCHCYCHLAVQADL